VGSVTVRWAFNVSDKMVANYQSHVEQLPDSPISSLLTLPLTLCEPSVPTKQLHTLMSECTTYILLASLT
jgi:hypothetical protein